MKHFRNFLVIAALAVLTAFSWTVDVIDKAVQVTVAAVRRTVSRGLELFATAPSVTVAENAPAKFREYRQRIERRDRPVIESTWRMCPSG